MATSLKIDDTLKGRVQHLAAIRDRSAHWIMCEAIRAYVDREEASWAEYQETGLHLTGEEMADWLNSWGTADEGECPPCHV